MDVSAVLCEGFDSPRARMSCGHVVTPMSLTKWCEELLKQVGYDSNIILFEIGNRKKEKEN